MAEWKDRRVSIGTKPASWFEANEKNFRTHPLSQGTSFVSVANAVGLVDAIKVNLRSGEEWGNKQNQPIVLDGHMRVVEALKQGDDTLLPVDFYDLTPEEEDLVLISLDYITKLAGTDRMAFGHLFESVMAHLDELEKDEHLQGLLEMMARENDIFLDNFDDGEEDMPEVDDIEPEEEMPKRVKIVVKCDPDRVDEITDYLDTILGCEWSRRK